MPEKHRKIIAAWLVLICFALLAMIVLGGVTRLTGSGLSMVDWRPVTGVLPPLDQHTWQQVFELYQASPEYRKVHLGSMDLQGFKSIFWFEYAHRLLGRSIGLLFLLPMLFFFIRGWIPAGYRLRFVMMFVLGGLQGLLGWYMVKSGLVDNPHVSQYRLVAHLALAVVIYTYIFLTAMSLLYPRPGDRGQRRSRCFAPAVMVSVGLFFTIAAGGFVAGLRAGFSYNTFPLMDGKWTPDGYASLQPFWRNLFENVAAVQYDHRLLATLMLFGIMLFWLVLKKRACSNRARRGGAVMLALALIQYSLGIATLLLVVPVPLAAAHQGVAILLYTASLYVTWQCYVCSLTDG